MSLTAQKNIKWGERKLKKMGYDPSKTWGVIDAMAGKHRQVKVGVVPTIIGSRANSSSFWLTNEKRFITRMELARIQGFEKLRFPKSIPHAQRGLMIGNAMSKPVLKFAMKQTLKSAGLLK